MKITYSRPQKIRNYTKQVEFIDAPERFTIVEATTKAGKTVGCIVWLFEQALKGKPGDCFWWVAPILLVAKIAYRRMKRYISSPSIYTDNKSECSITLVNGTTIYFKSADNPDSLYGEDVYACVLDEATRMSEDSWFAVFSTLTATRGKCKIIGNVKGTNNWVYKLAREAETGNKKDWRFFKITATDAVDAGILEQEVIDEARRTLPEGIFLELYFGIPFANASNKFCYCFDKKKHVGKCPPWRKDQNVYLSFDFNVNPITCSVIQWYDQHIYVLEVIKLENSNIWRLCEVVSTKYPEAAFIVTGDASGKNKSTLERDNLNNFDVIKKQLGLSRGQMQYLASNPKLEDNQVLVNAVLEHYDLTIDESKSQPLIFDCEFVEMLPDGTIKKGDRNDPTQQADAIDTFRYFINRFLKGFLKEV